MALRVDGVTEVEHRIESFHDAVVELDEVRGARAIAGPLAIGRTRSVVLRLERESYELRYRATQGAARRDRCPLWVPAIASTGQLGAITLAVRLPDDARPDATMPALSWSGRLGTAALAHVPAFVRVPYTVPGMSPGWDLGRVMDGLAAMFLVGASAVWLWQRVSKR